MRVYSRRGTQVVAVDLRAAWKERVRGSTAGNQQMPLGVIVEIALGEVLEVVVEERRGGDEGGEK